MLWRVRATLPDRPGALALLAAECGRSEVNILGFQVFPGVDLVTDELVLDSPEGWSVDDVAALVARSGGTTISVARCTEAALADQPTRYVQAAASVLAAPASFPDVLARLFDAEAEPASGQSTQDVLDVTVASVLVQVRRTAPFTATEHARAAALAGVVDDVLERAAAVAAPAPTGAAPEFVSEATQVTAVVDGASVGSAAIRPALDEPDTCVLTLVVDPAWRRRGIGSRLLAEAVRLAAARDASELVLTTRADNQAVLPMVLAAGLRGRIRMSGDRLTVRIPLAALQR
jgi:ribosomal protein S18 acetylase RimI-like enzyme